VNTGATHPSMPHLAKDRAASRIRHVAWWNFPGDSSYSNDILAGVLDYIAERGNWKLHQMLEIPDAEWPTWRGDGVFACCNLAPHAHLIEQMRIPVVAFSPASTLPWVDSDHEAVGIRAAEHLLERGLKHFGFRGSEQPYSEKCRDAFVRRIRHAGYACEVYTREQATQDPQVSQVARWLAVLPKPVGVMAYPSFHGREVLAACQSLGWAVPEDVAIITAKNPGNGSTLEQPPLSWVKLDTHRIGYEAAALLDRLMSGGQEPPGTAHLIAPQCVEARKSTDLCAISDPQVAAALRYIWQHACEGVQVKEILQFVPLSRRGFDARFQKLVGRTPHEEIVRLRMHSVKQLLSETNLPLKQIAACCGFKRIENFDATFRRVVKTTPRKYRALHGLTGSVAPIGRPSPT